MSFILIVEESTQFPDQQEMLKECNIPITVTQPVNLRLILGYDEYVFTGETWLMRGLLTGVEHIKKLLTEKSELAVRQIQSDGTTEESIIYGFGAGRYSVKIG